MTERAIPGGTGEAEPPPQPASPWGAFLLALGALLATAVAILFAGIGLSGERAIDAEIQERARTLVASIALVREWNGAHGGVWVEKRAGVKSSPWLPNPDVEGRNGKVYTLANHAVMARELSELSRGSQGFSFRLTSLKPLNPANAPDPFEEASLLAFERGAPDASRRERYGDSTWFRYMTPLRVEESCLECHERQGYRVGDVRGGVSVSFPVDAAERGKARTRAVTFLLFLATLAVLVTAVGWLVSGLRRRLALAEARIRDMAITDELTGLRNRRHITHRLAEEVSRSRRSGRPLSVLMFDVDHFKRVNDQRGHAVGDRVLRAVARRLADAVRSDDLVARVGGEEFCVLLPGADLAAAAEVGERIRTAVREASVADADCAVRVTVSAGVSTLEPGDDELSFVSRADLRLYEAKRDGRDRVRS